MKKIYRINFLILYYSKDKVIPFRRPILNIMENLACLYHFEYAISENILNDIEDVSDLIYFRSTRETTISKKDIDQLVYNIFKSATFSHGVDVGRQLYNALPEYPFPSVYYKPLNYPYMEIHTEHGATLYIHEEVLHDIINEDDQSVN